MKNKKIEKVVIGVTAVFVIVSLLFVFGGNIFKKREKKPTSDSTLMPTATGTTDEILKTTVVEQDFVNTTDTISKVGIVFSRITYKEGIRIAVELLEGNVVLASDTFKVSDVEDQHRTFLESNPTLKGMKNKNLTLKIYSYTKDDTGLVIMMDQNADASFKFGNKTVQGTLCFSVNE